MTGLYFLLGIVAWVVIYPYIRCFFKRLKCFFKVKRFCKKREYKLYGTHCLWFLGRKQDRTCDFYIETKETVYAVKLFAMLRRKSMLILREDGNYFIRKFAGVLWIPFFWNDKLKTIPSYAFRYKYKDEWTKKKFHNVLLLNPISMDIFRQAINGYEDAVGLGDEMYGMEIFSLSRLLDTIDNEGYSLD